MSIAENIIGTHYRYPDYFEVDREKIREFARAVKDDHPAHFTEDAARECGHDALIASLHRDQKLVFHRPILAGDKLWFDSYLDSVTESHGAVLTEIRGEVTDDNGEPVITSIVTVMGEAESDTEADELTAKIAAGRDTAALSKFVAGQK